MSTDKDLLNELFALTTDLVNVLISDKLELARRFVALETKIKDVNKVSERVEQSKPDLFAKQPAQPQNHVPAQPAAQHETVRMRPAQEEEPAPWELPEKPLSNDPLKPGNSDNAISSFDELPDPPNQKKVNPPMNDMPWERSSTMPMGKQPISKPPQHRIPPQHPPVTSTDIFDEPKGDGLPF